MSIEEIAGTYRIKLGHGSYVFPTDPSRAGIADTFRVLSDNAISRGYLDRAKISKNFADWLEPKTSK